MFALPSGAALVFLVVTAPICLWVAYTDLSRMKILNIAVGALLAVYVVVGPFVLPFEQYLWGYAHFLVALAIGFVLNLSGAMGAGDSKFIAAAAPFVYVADTAGIITIFAAFLLAAFFTHRIFRALPAMRRATPTWESWTRKKFPMGLALGPTLMAYFALAAITG